MDDHIDGANPFAAPMATAGDYREAPAAASTLPGYVKGWAIAALVFCSLRVLLVASSVAVIGGIPPEHPLYTSLLIEIAAGAGFALLGIIGNILLLMKNPLSLLICKLMVVLVLAHIAVCVWQAIQLIPDMGDPARQMGGYIGMVVVGGVRIALIVCYIVAVLRAQAYFKTVADQPETFA